jgi:glycosyltransferase involved in cell wall biosynthesis
MNRRPAICLVEPCHSHEEVLLPLIDLLHEDYEVHVIAPQSLLDVDLLRRTRHLYTAIPLDWNQRAPRWRRLLCMPGKYRQIRRLVEGIRPELVIFNSTYELPDLLLIAAFFRGVPKAQLIHNFQYFLKPGMRLIYDAFDLNLVISEEVHGYVTGHHPEYRSLEYVLPISFSAFESARATDLPAQPAADPALHLAVFGSAGGHRRNYAGLLNSLAAWSPGDRPPGFVLHLVGELPEDYRSFIRDHHLDPVVQYYDAYVTFEELFRVLHKVDIVLFLIDATVRDCAVYNRYKITGASTLIKGFGKACASSRDFRVDASLVDQCCFYESDRVEELFEAIADGRINPRTVRGLEAHATGKPLFSREAQRDRLLRALKTVRT